MATEGGVLGVIRAARPQFCSVHDRVAFAVHAVFQSAGYSLIAVGSRVPPDLPVGDEEVEEVGIEGWNDLDGAYAFLYSGAGQEGLCKFVLLKCVAVEDKLIVAVTNENDKEAVQLEFRVTDYATASEGTNYGQLYKRLNELVEQINSSLLSKLSCLKDKPSISRQRPSGTMVRALRDSMGQLYTCPDEILEMASVYYETLFTSDLLTGDVLDARDELRKDNFGVQTLGSVLEMWSKLGDTFNQESTVQAVTSLNSNLRDIKDDRIEGDARQSSILVDESAPSMHGLRYPPVPGYGSSDLLPGAGAGVFPSSVDPGVGGMLVGPNDPRWGSMGYGEMPILPDGDRGILPPGARYDPVGPPGVPGFEPGRFRRGRQPPGGGPNPDLEHFSPF
ncbi:hypothetical protein L7F22_039768 [Adiantum nelumboides]|nr:hypothetical protein [Adiantum nelumboides]